MNIYISIGSQCTTPTLFDRLNVKKESLPFDWMFSTPHFVYTIIKLLFIDKKQVEDIIDNDFFVCDARASLHDKEHHILNTNGSVLVNSKYNVCFPHDSIGDRDKYLRRIERFKRLILDESNFINFVYISVSSKNSGNYTINEAKEVCSQNILCTGFTFESNRPTTYATSHDSKQIDYANQAWQELIT